MQLDPPARAVVPDPAGRCNAFKAIASCPTSVSWASPVLVGGEEPIREWGLVGPEKPNDAGRWRIGLLASVALHGLVAAAIVVCALFADSANEPPLLVVGHFDLAGLGGGGPSGGDGRQGGLDGAARETAAVATDDAALPNAENVARTETGPTPAQTTEQAPDPTPARTTEPVPASVAEPAPELDARTPPPKPQARPKAQTSPRPRHHAIRSAKARPLGPPADAPAPVAVEHVSNTGTGGGTRAGDGSGRGLSGEGAGKGLTPGDGPGGNGDGRGTGGLSVGEFGRGDGPTFRHRSPLRYPDAAKRAGQEGKVRLRLDIDAEGVLRNVSVLEHTGLDFVEEALRAIKASTFYPAKRQGRAEACSALLTIRFALG